MASDIVLMKFGNYLYDNECEMKSVSHTIGDQHMHMYIVVSDEKKVCKCDRIIEIDRCITLSSV